VIVPDDLSPERAEWIRAAGDDDTTLYVGQAWDGRTDPPRLVMCACRTLGAPLSSTERASG
jgi:hypothetical protein